MMTGTVKFWNADKGYGFLVGDDGIDYFCHVKGLNGYSQGFKELEKEQKVEFEIEIQSDGRNRAVDVLVVG
jgi:cold shock protein